MSKGDVGLTFVIADLVKNDWIVSLPIQAYARYDLIATKGKTIRRIQVKYRALVRGAMHCLKTTTVGGEAYTEEDVDAFAITNGEHIAYITIQDTANKAISIRVEPSKNNQKLGCRNLEDYKLLL